MSTSQIDNSVVPLGKWVDDLINAIWFQPDDELAVKTFHEGLSPDLIVRVNHGSVTYDQYLGVVQQTRSTDVMTVQSNNVISVWNEPGVPGAGCVAHMSRWTRISKATGEETKAATLTLANVQVREGKRVLVELTEVMEA